MEDLSVAARLPHPAMIVLRSFGNTYGFASVRLGFALAAGAAKPIRDALGPRTVSGPAIGCAALADRAWLAATAARLARETLISMRSYRRPALHVICGHETVLAWAKVRRLR